MSLSISRSPAGPSSDGPTGTAASAKWNPDDLPFDAILNDQTDATDADSDPLAGLLPGVALGVRARLPDQDGITQDVAILNALGKKKSAPDRASVAVLVLQDVLRRLESFEPPGLAGDKASGPANVPTGPAVDDQLAKELRAALADIETAAGQREEAALPDAALTTKDTGPVEDAASAQDTPPPTGTDLAPSIADLLLKESARAQTERTPTDAPPARAGVAAPSVALVDAIRAALGQGSAPDQDQDFNQSASSGSDRRKSMAAPILHVAEAVARTDANVPGGASSPATVAPLPNEDGVVSSIVQTMRLQMRDGVGTAVVHLEPDYLGAVSIALRVENGVVTASLHAENPQVRAWMEANESMLRDSLAAQGLSLDRLLVTDERIGDDHSRGRQPQQEQEPQARQRPRRDEATTFEVIV